MSSAALKPVFIVIFVFFMGIATIFACAGHQIGPADPYR